MDFGNCATQTNNKIISAEENKRKLILNNPSGKVVTKVKVDGCLPITGVRCDYLFEIGDPKTKAIFKVLYLELKGEGVKHAYDQLVATLDLFADKHRGCTKECFIICSRVPKLTASVQQLNAQLKRTKKATLTVKTNQAKLSI